MQHYRFPVFMLLVCLASLVFSGCHGIIPPSTPKDKVILKGEVVIPIEIREIQGQALADADVRIVDPRTGQVVATGKTDKDGKYSIEVLPGGPYIVEASKGNLKVLDVSPKVEAGQSYDLGTADATSTAVALIFQERVGRGENPEAINIDAILNTPRLGNLINAIENALSAGQDPTQIQQVTNLVNVITSPPTPVAPAVPAAPIEPAPDRTPPRITALRFGGIDGLWDGTTWTVDLRNANENDLSVKGLPKNAVTLSEDCTLELTEVEGINLLEALGPSPDPDNSMLKPLNLRGGPNPTRVIDIMGLQGEEQALGFLALFGHLRTIDAIYSCWGTYPGKTDYALNLKIELRDLAGNKITCPIRLLLPEDTSHPAMTGIRVQFGWPEEIDGGIAWKYHLEESVNDSVFCRVYDEVQNVWIQFDEPVFVAVQNPVYVQAYGETGEKEFGTIDFFPRGASHEIQIIPKSGMRKPWSSPGTFTFKIPADSLQDAAENKVREIEFSIVVKE